MWFVELRFPWLVVGNFMFMIGGWFEKYFDLLLYFGDPWVPWCACPLFVIGYPFDRLLSCMLLFANFYWFAFILFSLDPI